ncbi:MAG: 3-deoxy-manno-octulosonate cytidylyltransferase [Candidatus Omnitrophica bacterium]|nr:3-deoxy-manno-octulosonate cytidylyltransferase [Candidatus Omnitrophota bacterium]
MAKKEENLHIIGVIPARLGSQRLPRKVLREIHGKILVEQVYSRASRSPLFDELWVATDSEEVRTACQERNVPVLMTSPKHASGTDRLYEVMQKKPADIYVNIQGDEPLVRPELLETLLKPFRTQKEIRVSTLKTKISPEAAKNPNVVKVVTDSRGWALYFSRSIIPYDREGAGQFPIYKHLGFYAYRAEALEKFHKLPPSSLEQSEKLEQLRLLENGIPIFVAQTPFDTIGVDTEEDLQRVTALLASEANSPKTLRAKVSISGRKQGV